MDSFQHLKYPPQSSRLGVCLFTFTVYNFLSLLPVLLFFKHSTFLFIIIRLTFTLLFSSYFFSLNFPFVDGRETKTTSGRLLTDIRKKNCACSVIVCPCPACIQWIGPVFAPSIVLSTWFVCIGNLSNSLLMHLKSSLNLAFHLFESVSINNLLPSSACMFSRVFCPCLLWSTFCN